MLHFSCIETYIFQNQTLRVQVCLLVLCGTNKSSRAKLQKPKRHGTESGNCLQAAQVRKSSYVAQEGEGKGTYQAYHPETHHACTIHAGTTVQQVCINIHSIRKISAMCPSQTWLSHAAIVCQHKCLLGIEYGHILGQGVNCTPTRCG